MNKKGIQRLNLARYENTQVERECSALVGSAGCSAASEEKVELIDGFGASTNDNVRILPGFGAVLGLIRQPLRVGVIPPSILGIQLIHDVSDDVNVEAPIVRQAGAKKCQVHIVHGAETILQQVLPLNLHVKRKLYLLG